jgi:hypothetical protein
MFWRSRGEGWGRALFWPAKVGDKVIAPCRPRHAHADLCEPGGEQGAAVWIVGGHLVHPDIHCPLRSLSLRPTFSPSGWIVASFQDARLDV